MEQGLCSESGSSSGSHNHQAPTCSVSAQVWVLRAWPRGGRSLPGSRESSWVCTGPVPVPCDHKALSYHETLAVASLCLSSAGLREGGRKNTAFSECVMVSGEPGRVGGGGGVRR